MAGRRRADRLRWGILVGIAVLIAVPSLPLATGRGTTPTPPVAGSPIPFDAASVYSGSFATRAGYDPGSLRSVSNALPAAGQELVVVTFYPSDASFFSPPPLGAHPLTVREIADRYGLAPAAYASAESYFETMGLTIVHSEPDRLSLTVGGSAGAIGRAFGTELESGTYEGRAVTFPASAPSLPAPLEMSVASVTGLSSGFDTFALPVGLPSLAVASGPQAGTDLITPAIARGIYDLSPLYNVSGSSEFAGSEGIVLLLWGDGYAPSDLSTFFSSDYPAGFPAVRYNAYPVDGAPPPSNAAPSDPSKAPQELTLDMEWSGSMAPGATLNAVYAPDGPAADNYSPTDASMTDAFHTAVTGVPGVSAISMSFGTPENASQSLAAGWTTDIALAAQQGITLLAATGDFGGDVGANCQGGATVDFPANSPEVIAVGGTNPTLARNLLGQVTGLADESAWSGSGGGFSSVNAAPSWQEVGSAAGPIAANGHRGLPDVSAAAAYNFLYYDGSSGVAAGTSFATPLWAGLVAEMDALYGSKLGFLTPRLYAVGASQETGKDLVGLADITSGSTCIGSATQGWDSETGWGSPRALLLYEDLTATFVDLSVSASPSPVAPGGSVTVVAQLANRTSGTPIAGVPISVSLQASDTEGPCVGVWGSATLTSNASGSVSLAVAIPTCFFGSHGTAQVSVTSDGYYGTNSTTVDVNLLGLVPALAGIEDFPQNIVAFGLIMGAAIAVGYVLGRGGPRRAAPPRTVVRPPPQAASASAGPAQNPAPGFSSSPPPPPPPPSRPPTT
ncbi:MAG: S53 family peptidase [Thermoplasmata archaeon]|jgi:kumamolisin